MPDKSIKQENYKENPEYDYTNMLQYLKNVEMFRKSGKILYPPTRKIYTFVKNYCIDFVKNHPQYPDFIWKPKIIDIGCGGGFGSNILSQEADYVWGIDKDKNSVTFAKQVFTREKNGVYYSPQVTFDEIDVLNEPREIQAFDIVVCVEVIEHVNEYEKLLTFIKKRCKKNKDGTFQAPPDATKVFISTPNRNRSDEPSDHPKNKAHVREWTPGEMYDILTKHFQSVILMDCEGNLKDLDMKDAVMLFKAEVPIL